MAEFKIGLGLEIEQEDKVAVQKIIDDIRAEKPEIKIKVNTEQALKNIKDLQKELKKIKDVKINIKTGSSNSNKRKASSNVNTALSTDTNNVSWAKGKTTSSKSGSTNWFDYDEQEVRDASQAYKELLEISKKLSKHRVTLEGLNPARDARQIDVVEAEIQKLLISYVSLEKEFRKDIPDEQWKNIDKIFEEARFSVNKLKASMEDTSEFKEVLHQFDTLRNKAKEIGKAEIRLAGLDVAKNADEVAYLTKNIDNLNTEYYELLNAIRHKLSAEQLIELANIFHKTEMSAEQLNAQISDTKNKLATAIGGKVDTKYKENIDNIRTSMTNLSSVSDTLQAEFNELNTILKSMETAKTSGDIDELIRLNNEYCQTLDKVKTSLKEAQNAQKVDVSASKLQDAKQKLSNDIDIWLQKNSASAKDFGAVLDQIKAQIQSADKIKLDSLQREFNQVKQEAELAGKTGLTFGDTLKKQWEQMKGYFTLYDVYSYAKQGITSMFQEVNKVDTAMSGLYRVTDLTTSQYQEMYNGMTESAKQYGLVLSELIDGATTWAKLGFSGTQASELGEISGRYQVVADTDAETAVTNLVTAYNGFKDELLNLYDGDDIKAVEYISDIFNKLGNEYAIDAESIGVALTKSASALSVAGNDIQQASGMITGITEKTGNAERGSNALKILSLRLRGKHIFGYNPNDLCLHTRKVRMLYCI